MALDAPWEYCQNSVSWVGPAGLLFSIAATRAISLSISFSRRLDSWRSNDEWDLKKRFWAARMAATLLKNSRGVMGLLGDEGVGERGKAKRVAAD